MAKNTETACLHCNVAALARSHQISDPLQDQIATADWGTRAVPESNVADKTETLLAVIAVLLTRRKRNEFYFVFLHENFHVL